MGIAAASSLLVREFRLWELFFMLALLDVMDPSGLSSCVATTNCWT